MTIVNSNRTRAARSFDFEITRMISDQIALQSVQLPLWIVRQEVKLLINRMYNKFQNLKWILRTSFKVIPVLHCASLLRIIYGVISARSCSCTLKHGGFALISWTSVSWKMDMGVPPFFPVIAINLSYALREKKSSDFYFWKLNK